MIPVALLMLVGLVEFGRLHMIRNTITDAARMGARTAVLPEWHSQSDIHDIVNGELSSKGLNPNLSATSVSGLNAPTGSQTQVTVQYQFNSILLSMIGRSSPITLRAVSTMIHE
jgi:Flp pilus assembly protein TadG